MQNISIIALTCIAISYASQLCADSFDQGADSFEIEFVSIGEDDGVTESTPYAYRMAKYEISEGIINVANRISASQSNPLDITQSSRGDHKPATMVTWFEAARFVNWLNIEAGSSVAYKFDDQDDLQLWEAGDDGYDPQNLLRNSFAKYFLPTGNEWLKSGYYNPTTDSYSLYPTGEDMQPRSVSSGIELGTAVWDECLTCGPADITLAGGPSVYGTVAQGGNVFEWSEAYGRVDERTLFIAPSIRDRFLNQRILHGGSWVRLGPDSDFLDIRSFFLADAANEDAFSGFRIASVIVPEPSTLALLICSGILLVYRRSFAGI